MAKLALTLLNEINQTNKSKEFFLTERTNRKIQFL